VPAFVSSACLDWDKEAAAEAERRGIDYRNIASRAELEDWARANPMPAATIADVADHIEHVRKVAGLDHVGIGGDFDGTSELPLGLEEVSCYPALFAELMDRGWTAADCGKLANGNILRVLRESVDSVDANSAHQARPGQPAGLAGAANIGRLVLGAETTGL